MIWLEMEYNADIPAELAPELIESMLALRQQAEGSVTMWAIVFLKKGESGNNNAEISRLMRRPSLLAGFPR